MNAALSISEPRPSRAAFPPAPAGKSGWPWNASLPIYDPNIPWPRITIVTPSFNQAQFLEETIRSVLLQGYPNLEYIVMDGGSTDGSADIIRKYSPWIDYWVSEKDNGQADAIYRGFERATGQIIGWLNSDDVYLPGALLRFAREFIQRPDTELLVGGLPVIDEEGNILRSPSGYPRYYVPARETFHKVLLFGMYNQPASLWRREAFFAVGGFDRSLYFAFDYDLMLRLTRRKPGRAIDAPLASFRMHSTSKTTSSQDVLNKEWKHLLKVHGADRIPAPIRWALRQYYVRLYQWKRRWFLLKDLMSGQRLPENIAQFETNGCIKAR